MADALNSKGWPTTCIAGSQDQKDRNLAMSKLKTFQCRVLISTDLTSRGIDADKVNLVINLDVPKDHETYLHRIGRAGRFGTFGACVTVASEGQEMLNLQSIEKKCNTSISKLPDPIPTNLVKTQGTINLDDMVSTEKIFTLKENGHAVDSLTSQNDETKHLSSKNYESLKLKVKTDQLNVTLASDLKNSIINDVKKADSKPIVLSRSLILGDENEQTDSSEKLEDVINGVKKDLVENLSTNHQNDVNGLLFFDKPFDIEDNSAELEKLKINDASQTKEAKSKPKKHATANFWTQLILERNDDKEFVQEFQDSQREEDIFDISLQIAKDLQINAKKSEKLMDGESEPQRRKIARRRNEQKQNKELVSNEISIAIPITSQKSSEIKFKIPSLTETVGFERLENTHTYTSAVNSWQTFSEKMILSEEVDTNVAINLGNVLGYDQDLLQKVKEILTTSPLQTQVKADLRDQNLNGSLHCPADNVQKEGSRQTIKAIKNRQKPSAINRKSNLSFEKQLEINIPPSTNVDKQTASSTHLFDYSYLGENGGELNLKLIEDKVVKSVHVSGSQRQKKTKHIEQKAELKKPPDIKIMSCSYDSDSKSTSKSDTLVIGETNTDSDNLDARNRRQDGHYTKYSENNYFDGNFDNPKPRNDGKQHTYNYRTGDFTDSSENEESHNKGLGNPDHFNWKDYHKAFEHNQFSYPYSYLHSPFMYMQQYPYMNCYNPYSCYNPWWNSYCYMPYQNPRLPYDSLYKNLEMQQKYIKMMLKSYKKMIQNE